MTPAKRPVALAGVVVTLGRSSRGRYPEIERAKMRRRCRHGLDLRSSSSAARESLAFKARDSRLLDIAAEIAMGQQLVSWFVAGHAHQGDLQARPASVFHRRNTISIVGYQRQ